MRRRRLALALADVGVVVGVALALVGCSGSPSPRAASPSPGTTPSSDAASPGAGPTASASGSPSPSLATLPPARCLSGTWDLVRFVGASDQTYGTGEGGDVALRFSGGAYTLAGAGKKPLTLTLAGQTARLTINGGSKGTFTLEDSTATFRQRSTSGHGTLAAGGQQQQLPMSQVSAVVGLEGKGEVACTAQAMTITLATVRLELGRT
jgi:hypothetical protein